jgi:hypothetical protein
MKIKNIFDNVCITIIFTMITFTTKPKIILTMYTLQHFHNGYNHCVKDIDHQTALEWRLAINYAGRVMKTLLLLLWGDRNQWRTRDCNDYAPGKSKTQYKFWGVFASHFQIPLNPNLTRWNPIPLVNPIQPRQSRNQTVISFLTLWVF